MRRPMFLLSLIAALAGTPLRLAEAADDIACSLAELGDGSVIEAPDGGVGDDPEATIRAEVGRTRIPAASTDPGGRAGSLIPATLAAWRSPRHPASGQPRPAASHTRRLALLRCFLC